MPMDVTGIGDRPLVALAGRYEVERELGRGGMATVWLATDTTSGQLVAIKMLHPDLTAALGARRFQREIEIERSLDHPHILSITDAGEAGGHLYYVMPYVRGESLRARLQRDGPLPVEDALRLATQVARALAYAHARGIVHRDVKPENILLDEDGQAILADFGIARALSADQEQRLTQTGVTLGTPTYMSPEQCMAEKGLDGRSDIYSLGCVLFEMLAGEPPFTGANAQAVTARHLLEAVPCLTLVRPTVSDEVEDVVLRALAKTPADRFATVDELATALERLLTTGHATSARTVATPRNVLAQRRQRRRQRTAWVAAAGALLVASLVGVVAWRRGTSTVTPETAEAARHVAVLYFDDLTPGRRLGWLADGLTESLIDELARVQALDVVSRNGVLPFRDADPGRDSIARALGVGLLVDGRVEEDAGRVRVTVDLVDAASGANLRTHTFTQPEGDALALRDSLATTLETYLRSQIGEQVRRREQRDRTQSDEAWTLVQRVESARKRAGAMWDGGDTAGASRLLAQADSMALRAATLDPRWAAPVVLRGQMAYQRATNAPEPAAAAPWLDSALAHARTALARDARNAEALELRGAARYARVQHGLARDSADVRALVDSAEADLRAATTLA
ncbi:MAG TPA: serine/threonine-protein kinase, partial [Gemmatimonadaceae bacterium]|nr:serine/threonine-protein kinase [Gemmatimonadaceae bacterium]